MRVKLTAKYVENIKPEKGKRLQFWDTTLPGFGLRVTEKGKKSWVVMYRSRGRQRRMTIGRYPAFSLAEARDAARTALRTLEQGVDPAEEKLAAKRRPDATFADVVEQFIELYARPKNRGWKETRRILHKNVVPRIGHYALHEVERHHIIDILDTIVARGAPTQANRVLAHVRKLFNWALDRGMVEYNPVFGLKPPAKEVSRDRVLTDEELKRLWPVWDEIEWPFGQLFKLLLLTGQRRNEVATMRWSDIDFANKTWTIPREVAKNDRTHEVPLSDLALEIIESVPRVGDHDLIFSTTGRTAVSGFSKAKKVCDTTASVFEWRTHDLRRTCASGMARLGIHPHVVEKILNHSSGTISGVSAVYNRYAYDDEKRSALELWSNHLQLLINQIQMTGSCTESIAVSDPTTLCLSQKMK